MIFLPLIIDTIIIDITNINNNEKMDENDDDDYEKNPNWYRDAKDIDLVGPREFSSFVFQWKYTANMKVKILQIVCPGPSKI